jgi:hypothetical protein
MLGVNDADKPAHLLGLSCDRERKGRLSAHLRTEQLYDATARQTTDTQGDIQCDSTRWDNLDTFETSVIEPENGTRIGFLLLGNKLRIRCSSALGKLGGLRHDTPFVEALDVRGEALEPATIVETLRAGAMVYGRENSVVSADAPGLETALLVGKTVVGAPGAPTNNAAPASFTPKPCTIRTIRATTLRPLRLT